MDHMFFLRASVKIELIQVVDNSHKYINSYLSLCVYTCGSIIEQVFNTVAKLANGYDLSHLGY